jgi:hypothetical protein
MQMEDNSALQMAEDSMQMVAYSIMQKADNSAVQIVEKRITPCRQ